MKNRIMTQSSSFPTPMIPPNRVARVFRPTSSLETLTSTFWSNWTNNPYMFSLASKPVLSTLYLKIMFRAQKYFLYHFYFVSLQEIGQDNFVSRLAWLFIMLSSNKSSSAVLSFESLRLSKHQISCLSVNHGGVQFMISLVWRMYIFSRQAS